MDYTLEIWTIQDNHFAMCTCGWMDKSLYQPVLESYVKNHKKTHTDNGDSVEIV